MSRTTTNPCPICRTEMRVLMESASSHNSPQNWWSGRYLCSVHGEIRASGSTLKDGQRSRSEWVPACRDHGTDSVVSLHLKSNSIFLCRACNRKLEVRNGRIITTWRPFRNSVK
jgi:hypothetical protein